MCLSWSDPVVKQHSVGSPVCAPDKQGDTEQSSEGDTEQSSEGDTEQSSEGDTEQAVKVTRSRAVRVTRSRAAADRREEGRKSMCAPDKQGDTGAEQ
ncbi:hypothetical protein P7K49_015361 [Saguinus oedipus]|uniref:Uncharacterized protein n=1 Tax=Saguinus oedipus TaxID=9490 RepID=A0ABQ9VBX4_SAGOE|nr:hypothetical protein P7K49_015361 [Saguinus oedipus]